MRASLQPPASFASIRSASCLPFVACALTTTMNAETAKTAEPRFLRDLCGLCALRLLVRVDYSVHVLPMTIRAGLVDIPADGEQPIGVFRLGRTDRLLTGVDHLLGKPHPVVAVLRAWHEHEQVPRLGHRDGRVAHGGPFLVGLRTDFLRAILGVN